MKKQKAAGLAMPDPVKVRLSDVSFDASMDVDSAFGHWFAGFVDGEGCFCAKVTNVASKVDVRAEFSIILRQDDRSILEEIRDRLGMGRITDYGEMTNRQGVRSNPRSRWRVSKLSDCRRLMSFFRHYPLRAKKAHDLHVWGLILDAMASTPRGNRWRGQPDRTKIVFLVDRLRSEREYRSRGEVA